MRAAALAIVLTVFCQAVHAEDYLCTYSWPDRDKQHPVLLVIDGQKAKVRSGNFDEPFLVAANSPTELLIYRAFTKGNSGSEYPVGFSTYSLDKKTRALVYSNSFTGGNQNNHATGTCAPLVND